MKKHISTKQLQEKLSGRGRTTIYRDVELGRLPKPIKIGSRNFWDDEEVDETIQENAAQ